MLLPFRFLAALRSWRDRRGVAAIVFALAAPAIIGLVGLGTEAGLWYLTKTKAQTAADTASYAGAVRLALAQSTLGLSLTNARLQASDAATDTATQNGFTGGASGGTTTMVAVNTPPVSGAYTTDSAAVQVKVQRTLPRLLSGMFLGSDPIITVTSTSTQVASGTGFCVLALSGGLSAVGSAAVTATSCGVASAATGGNSVVINNAGNVNATSLLAAGSCNITGTTTTTCMPNQTVPDDPFKSLQSNTYPSSCPSGSATPPTSSGTVLNPTGTLYYCSSWNLGGGATVDLRPGTYIIYNGNLAVNNGTTLKCSTCAIGGAGVTFVLTGSTAAKVGYVDIEGGANVSWSAPFSGTYGGIALYRDALGAYSSSSPSMFANGTTTNVVGGIYMPTGMIDMEGGSGLSTSNCKTIVAETIKMANNGQIKVSGTNCSTVGTPLAYAKTPRLVE